MIDWKKANAMNDGQAARFAHKVLDRAQAVGFPITYPLEFTMDMLAANVAAPLDWEKLITTDRGTFYHDVGGIHRHLNRDTGELMDCFLPRCALPGDTAELPDPQTRREAIADALNATKTAVVALSDLQYDELAEDARKLADNLFCVLRNKTNPKYGGDPAWQGGNIDGERDQ